MVHVSKLKKVKIFPNRPINTLRVAEADRVDFNEAILPEDSWKTELEDNEFEAERIVDVKFGWKTRFGRVHRQF